MSLEVDECSLDLALADIELLCAAYPDEVVFIGDCNETKNTNNADDDPQETSSFPPTRLPLTVTLHLASDALIDLKFDEGYPKTAPIRVSRSRSSKDYACLQLAVKAVERTALECMEQGIEGALSCCAAAFEAWNSAKDDQNSSVEDLPTLKKVHNEEDLKPSFVWVSGEPLVDRKSVFQAHLCRVYSENDVRNALQELHLISNKITRATHNMWACRYVVVGGEGQEILHHNNDDDGEDGAGSRLAHLLEMRKDDGVLVVVSRWYGGVHLGPKRFAHISNVARKLLVAYQSSTTS